MSTIFIPRLVQWASRLLPSLASQSVWANLVKPVEKLPTLLFCYHSKESLLLVSSHTKINNHLFLVFFLFHFAFLFIFLFGCLFEFLLELLFEILFVFLFGFQRKSNSWSLQSSGSGLNARDSRDLRFTRLLSPETVS